MKAFRAAQLEPELRNVAFGVLRRLCGRLGHFLNSYLLSGGFYHSGILRASDRYDDLRMGMFKGRSVAVKLLRVSEVDDKVEILGYRVTGHPGNKKALAFFRTDVGGPRTRTGQWRRQLRPGVGMETEGRG